MQYKPACGICHHDTSTIFIIILFTNPEKKIPCNYGKKYSSIYRELHNVVSFFIENKAKGLE